MGQCLNCRYNEGLRVVDKREMVACSSKAHADFMDEPAWYPDRNFRKNCRYNRMLKLTGAMPLLSTMAIGLECPNWNGRR